TSLRIGRRSGRPEPNLVRVTTPAGPGLVNCNGFQTPGLDASASMLPRLRHERPVIVSVAGESPEDYQRLVKSLERYADLVEANISSPNTRLVYELSGSPARVRALLRLVREATRKPFILQPSPDYPAEHRRAVVPAARDAGVDAINFGNTRRIDEPRLSQRAGGLSGPELFPTVLETIRGLRRTVGPHLGLIATGGVDSPDKALAALEAGADAGGCLTAVLTHGPPVPPPGHPPL